MALANKTALTLADITGPIAFDEEASVVCVDGRPTGELQEWAAVLLVQYVVPTADAETRYGWFRESFRRFNEIGLTAIHAMDGPPEEMAIYRRLEENEDLTCRVVVPLWQQPDATFEDMRDQRPRRRSCQSSSGGANSDRTAAMTSWVSSTRVCRRPRQRPQARHDDQEPCPDRCREKHEKGGHRRPTAAPVGHGVGDAMAAAQLLGSRTASTTSRIAAITNCGWSRWM